jgi:tyrosyl-tRNA synthetase
MNGLELFGLTTPLLTTADGAKMGKSVNGAVWLNEELLPHYDFWQFWRNTDDRDVGRFLRIFTDLPLDEIARLEALQGSEINDAKVVLANEVTALVARPKLQRRPRRRLRPPCRWRSRRGPAQLRRARGRNFDHRCAGRYRFAASRGEAKRLVAGGGARLDGEAISDEGHRITLSTGKYVFLRARKTWGA